MSVDQQYHQFYAAYPPKHNSSKSHWRDQLIEASKSSSKFSSPSISHEQKYKLNSKFAPPNNTKEYFVTNQISETSSLGNSENNRKNYQVSHLDTINYKIKNILSSIHEEEKRRSTGKIKIFPESNPRMSQKTFEMSNFQNIQENKYQRLKTKPRQQQYKKLLPRSSSFSGKQFPKEKRQRSKKKYDEEMEILKQKIGKLQKLKKEMNIQLKYNHKSPIALSTNKKIYQEEKNLKNQQKPIKMYTEPNTSNITKRIDDDVCVPKILQNLSSKKKNKMKKNKENIIPLDQKKINKNLSLLADSKSHNNQKSKKTLQKFLQKLVKQIQRDEIFRTLKKWFSKWKNEHKWYLLKNLLIQDSLYNTDQQMKAIFGLTAEEENPFYAPREDDYQPVHLLEAFKEAEQHWQYKIHGRFDKVALNDDGFSKNSIDICHKGFILLEDFVRFLNFQMDTFFRNRDLFLIYERLRNGNDFVYFEDLMDNFCHKK